MAAVGETLRLRREMAQILVQKAGFTVLALESGFPEGLALDA